MTLWLISLWGRAQTIKEAIKLGRYAVGLEAQRYKQTEQEIMLLSVVVMKM